MSEVIKRERAIIGSVLLEWAVVDVGCRAWWYVMILVSHMDPVTTIKVNFVKSYLTQFWLNLSRSYAQIKAQDV